MGRFVVRGGEHALARGAQLLDLRSEQLTDQPGLVAEVLVDRRDARIRVRGDFVDIDGRITPLAEERLGRIEDRLLALFSLELAQAGHARILDDAPLN